MKEEEKGGFSFSLVNGLVVDFSFANFLKEYRILFLQKKEIKQGWVGGIQKHKEFYLQFWTEKYKLSKNALEK